MLGDYSSDIEDRTAAAVRELRETARELEVSRSDYAEMQRAVQLLQVIDPQCTNKNLHGNIQGDHSGCAKPPFDTKTKVAF